MANCCEITLEIVAETTDDAQRISDGIVAERRLSYVLGKRMFIGSYDRRLDYIDFIQDGNDLTLYGEVRWGISDDEMKQILQWLQHFGNIRMVCCHMEESGCMIYGDYEWYSDTPYRMTYTYLPDGHYPAYKDEYDDDPDQQVADLEEAFDKHKVVEEIACV